MKETNDILDKIGRRSGMTVPEDFFDNFVAKMSQSLPQVAVPEPEPQRSLWNKMRPYVYMAAMFAGIWCMMKMFGVLSGPAPDLTDINNYPGVMTALNDPSFVNECIYPDIDQYQLMEDIFLQATDSIDSLDSLAIEDITDEFQFILDDSI